MKSQQFPHYSNSQVISTQSIGKQQSNNYTIFPTRLPNKNVEIIFFQDNLSLSVAAMADIRLCLKNVSAEAQKWQLRILCNDFGVQCGSIQSCFKDSPGYRPPYQTVFIDLDSDSWFFNPLAALAFFYSETTKFCFRYIV